MAETKQSNTKPSRVTVTIDMTSADVIKYNNEGVELFFDDSVEKFKTNLTPSEVECLSTINRAKHRAAYALYKLNCEERSNPSPTKNLSTFGRETAPHSRFKVFNKNPAFRYSWLTSNLEYQAQMNGAEPVTRQTDPNLRFTGGNTLEDGNPTIGIPGRKEQRLFRYPKELYKKNVEDPPAKKSQNWCNAHERSSANQMRQNGGRPFTRDDKRLMGDTDNSYYQTMRDSVDVEISR